MKALLARSRNAPSRTLRLDTRRYHDEALSLFVQTITVPSGGAAVVDMTLDVPGEYVLVEHALSRAARGLVGKLFVDGEDQPALFRAASFRPDETESNAHSSH